MFEYQSRVKFGIKAAIYQNCMKNIYIFAIPLFKRIKHKYEKDPFNFSSSNLGVVTYIM